MECDPGGTGRGLPLHTRHVFGEVAQALLPVVAELMNRHLSQSSEQVGQRPVGRLRSASDVVAVEPEHGVPCHVVGQVACAAQQAEADVVVGGPVPQ
jgi:hypothetical protein